MNVNKYFVLIVCCMAFVNEGQSQDTLKSVLSIGMGINDLRNKDDFQSPYTYKGSNVMFHGAFSSFRKKGNHSIAAVYSPGEMRSVVSPDARNQLLQVNYEYLRYLNQYDRSHRLTVSVGPGIHTLVSSTNYLPRIERPVNYFTGAAYLTLNGNVRFQLSRKDVFILSASLPLVGVVHRPDFEINGKTLTKATAFGNNGLYNLSLEYHRQLTKKICVSLTYRYSYFNFSQPRPITILQNGLSIGVSRKLK